MNWLKKLSDWFSDENISRIFGSTTVTRIYINDKRVDKIPDSMKQSLENMRKSVNDMFDSMKNL